MQRENAERLALQSSLRMQDSTVPPAARRAGRAPRPREASRPPDRAVGGTGQRAERVLLAPALI